MMDRLLIDTDVIMDFFFDRKPFSECSTEVLNLCAQKKVSGYITPVIISNVYYLLRKTAQHKVVVERLQQFLTVINVLQMDKNIVMSALNSDFKDFEDALQNFSAIESGKIEYIITRNTKDFKKSDLRVLSPEDYLIERLAN